MPFLQLPSTDGVDDRVDITCTQYNFGWVVRLNTSSYVCVSVVDFELVKAGVDGCIVLIVIFSLTVWNFFNSL